LLSWYGIADGRYLFDKSNRKHSLRLIRHIGRPKRNPNAPTNRSERKPSVIGFLFLVVKLHGDALIPKLGWT
jgi:hypothetical protein